MLQTHHLSLRSLQRHASGKPATFPQAVQRSQVGAPSNRSLEALCDSLPENLSPNKRAMINRLVALYEQGVVS